MKTLRLTHQDLSRGAELLRTGGLVAIPTETVYGLGANGLMPAALDRIFAAKGRPQDNPLILHLPSAEWLPRCCVHIPPLAWTLAAHFWPGPLTLILPRHPDVPDEVTAGLDTVGVRCPDHPLTRTLIELAGVPVAAPSANVSGRPSPTTAAHVLDDLDGKIEAVLDGGPCALGVESTILDLTVSPPRLLRPGGLPLEDLAAVAGEIAVDGAVVGPLKEGQAPRAPGMKYRHYAPRAPVTVVVGDSDSGADYIARRLTPTDGVLCFSEYCGLFSGHIVKSLGQRGQPIQQAQRLFDALRAFDDTGVTHIWAQCPSEAGLGLAVSNRIKKAAGFHVIEVKEGAP